MKNKKIKKSKKKVFLFYIITKICIVKKRKKTRRYISEIQAKTHYNIVRKKVIVIYTKCMES